MAGDTIGVQGSCESVLISSYPSDLPARRRRNSVVEPRGFEPLTSAVQRRSDSLLEISLVYKIPANRGICPTTLSPSVQKVYPGCCTVAARVGDGHRVASALISSGITKHWP